MSETFLSGIRAALPLRVQRASWTEPTLLLGGPDWHLSATCAWRVSEGGVFSFGWESDDAAARVERLVGAEMAAADEQSRWLPADPALGFSDGRRLELFSAHFLEPWVLRLPAMTWVASPSDPAWYG